jgi:putative glycosyl hydrolase-like family 15 (GHL15) protein
LLSRLFAGVAAALAISGSLAMPAGAPVHVAAAGPFPSTGRYLQNYAPTYMTPKTTYSLTQAVQIARSFDVVAAHPNNGLGLYIPQMKAANPNVRIFVYLNGSFVPPGEATLYPTSYYAHDSRNNKITSTKFGNYLMDVGNTFWATTVASKCQSLLAVAPYDGCFVDMLGDTLVLHAGFLSATPINPTTGLAWTAQERMDATTKIAQAVVTKIAPKLVMANGLAAGYRYFATTAPTSQLLTGAPSAQAETWLRQATRPVTTFETEAAWYQDITMLANVTARGRAIAVTTKVWITATKAQIDQWHKYSLASFLMGTQGTAYYAFLAPNTSAAFTQAYAWDNVAIGTPTSIVPVSTIQNVYMRAYTGGMALVNVSSTTSYTVTLARACTTLTGTSRVTTVTLPPESGEVCHY